MPRVYKTVSFYWWHRTSKYSNTEIPGEVKKTKKEQDRFVPGSTGIIAKARYQVEWKETCVPMYFWPGGLPYNKAHF